VRSATRRAPRRRRERRDVLVHATATLHDAENRSNENQQHRDGNREPEQQSRHQRREDGAGPPLRGGPRIRRSALRALAELDTERAVSAAIAALADDAWSVRSAAVGILTNNASRVNFDIVSRRVRSLSDPEARGNLLRVFLEAPKWEAPAFLLEALTDPDNRVRTLAAGLVDRWIEGFNRSQTQPTAKQLQRIGALLDSVASGMPEGTAKMLRFSIKP
jgi:hypothetical protein